MGATALCGAVPIVAYGAPVREAIADRFVNVPWIEYAYDAVGLSCVTPFGSCAVTTASGSRVGNASWFPGAYVDDWLPGCRISRSYAGGAYDGIDILFESPFVGYLMPSGTPVGMRVRLLSAYHVASEMLVGCSGPSWIPNGFGVAIGIQTPLGEEGSVQVQLEIFEAWNFNTPISLAGCYACFQSLNGPIEGSSYNGEGVEMYSPLLETLVHPGHHLKQLSDSRWHGRDDDIETGEDWANRIAFQFNSSVLDCRIFGRRGWKPAIFYGWYLSSLESLQPMAPVKGVDETR